MSFTINNHGSVWCERCAGAGEQEHETPVKKESPGITRDSAAETSPSQTGVKKTGACWLSPDCIADKCRACDGAAFDHDNDEITDCGCRCHLGGSES